MKSLFESGLIFILLCSCNKFNHGDKLAFDLDSLEKEELKITLINDTTQIRWIIKDYKSFWSPTNDQMNSIDSIIVKGIQENQRDFYRRLNPASYKSYYRQYVCYTLANGDSMVYIRAICEVGDYPMEDKNGQLYFKRNDWQNKFQTVMDGGDCYWHIWINFTKRKYLRFIVHGLA
jgi:hypothetical protein